MLEYLKGLIAVGLLNQIAALIFAGFIAYMLFKFIKSNPESLSGESLNRSLSTMGLISIILIGFVGLIVMLLK